MSRFLSKPRAALATAFLSALAVAWACTKKNSEPAGAANASVPANELSIPPFNDPLDPRKAWINDLIQPRLSKNSSLVWTCSEDGSAVEIDLTGLGATCAEFLRVNFPNLKSAAKNSPASCPKPEVVSIPIKDGACRGGAKPESLSQLRLPSGTGLYVSDNAARLRPRFENLPPLVFSNSTSRRMQTPDPQTWLENAGPRGAIVLSLQSPRPDFPRGALNDFISHTKAAKSFRPSLDPSVPLSASKLPLVNVVDAYSEPLFHEACRYLSHWLKTREMLSETDRIDPSKEITVNCVFTWADDPISENALVLAHLPLPLSMEDSSYFPFKTTDDSLSPSLLQSLRLVR